MLFYILHQLKLRFLQNMLFHKIVIYWHLIRISFSRKGELQYFHVKKQSNLFKQSCCFKKAAKFVQ